MKQVIMITLTFFWSLAFAKNITCRTHENGLFYVDGVKQCRYTCADSCSTTQVIGPGWEGDFGAFHCFGAKVRTQPMPNGDLSPVPVGFEAFQIQTHGLISYWHAVIYGELYDQVQTQFRNSNCQH